MTLIQPTTIDVFGRVADEGRWIGTEGGFDRAKRAEAFAETLAPLAAGASPTTVTIWFATSRV